MPLIPPTQQLTDMKRVLEDLLAHRAAGSRQVLFANDASQPPATAYQVNFSRLEIVLEGRYANIIGCTDSGKKRLDMVPFQCLYIPQNAWNMPQWSEDAKVLSILFGKRQFGFSLITYSAALDNFSAVRKYHRPLTAHSPAHGMLQAMNAISIDQTLPNNVASEQVHALLTLTRAELDCEDHPILSAAEEKFRLICVYVQEHFWAPLTRELVADHFHISPTQVSRIFRKFGQMHFNEYVTYVRLDRAKYMLRNYDLQLDYIAPRCGFADADYFCRVFKKKVGLTPTQYRRRR